MNTATIGKAVLVLRLICRKVLVRPHEAVLSARLALWVVVVSLLARHMSLPRAHRIVSSRVLRRSAVAVKDVESASDLARTLDRLLGLDFFVFRRSCWKRAIVLQRFLALNGIESQISFGVQKHADGTLRGHAWLERQGRPLLEDGVSAYLVTFRLPAHLRVRRRIDVTPRDRAS